MDRIKSLKEVFLKATKIYEPEYLENRRFFYPCEIVLSIIRGFDIYAWLTKVNGYNHQLLDYLRKVKYYQGVSVNEVHNHISNLPLIIFNPINMSIKDLNKVFKLIEQRIFRVKTSALQCWWNTITDELLLNVQEHSEAMNGIIFVQNIAKLGILEIVIYDNGVGISGSLSKAKKRYLTPLEGLSLVLQQRESAKKYYDNERGEGIATVRRLVTGLSVLEGELVIMSGNVAAYMCHEKKEILSFPLRCVTGTLVVVRINNERGLYNLSMEEVNNLIADYD